MCLVNARDVEHLPGRPKVEAVAGEAGEIAPAERRETRRPPVRRTTKLKKAQVAALRDALADLTR
ncbi:hypothetical protein ACTI_49950 [Actinoplanes sp. OR16]|uniref:hypothetical protein n=1 Tax=Actinoplanes sp. OR16 TaxID=946334 RepID=UPI000F6EBEA2|nr:hypothetical protein [Actinoplanes sp. OR16]BBH68310.1 hypothetical protein ACTI_49950 [Actinoplanes sp. OR16]